jgi:hypothetical protein
MNTEEINKVEEVDGESYIEQVTETPIDMSKISEASRGQNLVGINYADPNEHEIYTCKNACAFLIDVLEKHREELKHANLLNNDIELLMNNSIAQVLNAHHNVVSTLKYIKRM